MLPSFLGIGVQRSATTWVHNCLKEHPGVYVPEEKELRFFDENYERGFAWYEKYFETSSEGQVVGEITPNYFNVPDALARISEHLPEVKLFVIFREPVSRARSAYRLLLDDKYKNMTFRQAMDVDGYMNVPLNKTREPVARKPIGECCRHREINRLGSCGSHQRRLNRYMNSSRYS